MDTTISIDLAQVARDQGIPFERVQRTVELLDEGNTVPFITRYRKDQTGGLDEEQIRRILEEVTTQRQLAERKQTILKSIESQGKLTPELAGLIRSARSPKHLEDLYLPFKPKKQTLATLARQRGLEPLALEILQQDPAAVDLTARATQLVNPDQKLATVDDVLAGVRHILAEQFSERSDLRSRLRRIVQRTGRLLSSRIEPSEKRAAEAAAAAAAAADPASPTADSLGASPVASSVELAESETPHEPVLDETEHLEHDDDHEHDDTVGDPHDELLHDDDDELTGEELHGEELLDDDGAADEGAADEGAAAESISDGAASTDSASSESAANETLPEAGAAVAGGALEGAVEGAPEGTLEGAVEPAADAAAEEGSGADQAVAPAGTAGRAAASTAGLTPKTATVTPRGLRPTAIPPVKLTARQQARAAAREAKKKKKQKLLESLYKDYYQYQEPLSKVPPHRMLAINRGERSQVLRVRIEADHAALEREALELLVPPDHPHAAFLQSCVHDALNRLVMPSLEREVRREMTDKAERHAVDVFVRNLRKLLLQPPVHGRRVLAIDPGFRSGCKLAALDEFGNLIDHGTIHIIGPEQHRQLCRSRLVELIRKHRLSVLAIGNGTACRETEQLVADILGNELKDEQVEYVIVNEAGASVYSTSPIGREELPKYDATVRGAVSIGRRLLDPLSELVKINPANIGVGLYQHDLKAKHLRESLDAVVESCVNYVGVDVNTASPALLRYVSGLNQLTARRLYEYRLQHGPFQSREQFKQVPGFGEATFVQSAGFLKIYGGASPLDATWIHPESYDVARRLLERLESSEADLAIEVTPAPTAVALTPAPAPFGGDVIASAAAPADTAVAGPAESTEGATTELAAIPTETAASEAVAAPASTAGEEAAISADALSTDPSAVVAPAAVAPAAAAERVLTNAASAVAPEPSAVTEAASDVVDAGGTAAVASDREPLSERIARVHAGQLSQELAIGELSLRDMLLALARPTRDPREDLPPPVFRRGIMKLEDLASGMELSGTVLNVVDFGVFVDIGLSDSALVHISRLADRFIKDPHEVVGIGDVLKVWVVEVDKQRRRVSLTAIQPGSERPRDTRPPRGGKPEGNRDERPAPAGGRRPPPANAGRPAAARPQQGGARPAGGRPSGGRPSGGPPPKGGRPPRPSTHVVKPKKSAPSPPITKGMIEGSEPMRTFGDLMQFFQKKKEGDEPEKKGDS